MLQLIAVLAFLCTRRGPETSTEPQQDKEKGPAPQEHEKLPLLTGSFDSSYGSEDNGSNSELVLW